LAATIQRDLIEPWCLINFGEAVIPPTLRCVTEEPEDREAFFKTLVPLIDRNLRVEQSVVRDRLGIPAPEEGDSVSVLLPLNSKEVSI
jgi:phage gp29-like protein